MFVLRIIKKLIMKNFFKTSLRIILILILLPIIYLNISLYYQPNFATINGQSYNEDVYHQLRFIKRHITHYENDFSFALLLRYSNIH